MSGAVEFLIAALMFCFAFAIAVTFLMLLFGEITNPTLVRAFSRWLSPEGRAIRHHERTIQKQVREYVNLGMTPADAEKVARTEAEDFSRSLRDALLDSATRRVQ